jgi:DNA-binding CsgD family transcriptional regulator
MRNKKRDKELLHRLSERVKELNCLYGLSRLCEDPGASLEKIFQGITDLLPASWQYHNIACARIFYEGKAYKTKNFKETKWRQSAAIKVFNINKGVAEVYYLKERPRCYDGPFLKEEKLLIDAVGRQLGKIVERKNMEIVLKESRSQLEKQKMSLEQKNAALREIIEQIEIDKNNIKESIVANLEETVYPIVEKLRVKKEARKYVDLLKHHLGALTSSFRSRVKKKNFKMTPREIEICNMIKANLANKEIAQFLNISLETVETHRRNIRTKLKLSNKKLNLASYLQQL